MNLNINEDENFEDETFKNWKKKWHERLSKNNNTPVKYIELMRKFNPIVIPRNHKVEEAIDNAIKGDLDSINKITNILNKPYINQKDLYEYQKPSYFHKNYKTFCGT